MRTFLSILGVLVATPAVAGELQISLGAGGAATTWDGDSAYYSSLRGGYRFKRFISVDFMGKLGYGDVDDRLLSEYTVGGTIYGRLGRTRPNLRLALAHQHEESMVSVEQDPFGALFGVGNGIRHRAGGYAAIGLDVPIREASFGTWTLGTTISVTYFPDERGPARYWFAGVSLGVDVEL